MTKRPNIRGRQYGQSLVEVAIMLPFLLVLALGVIEMGFRNLGTNVSPRKTVHQHFYAFRPNRLAISGLLPIHTLTAGCGSRIRPWKNADWLQATPSCSTPTELRKL